MPSLDPSRDTDPSDLIDRIVDGDLTPAQLRVALDRLDQSPDAWKRCTLAFLEAQCWRHALQALDSHIPSPPKLGMALMLQASRPFLRAAVAAASIAASVSLGWFSRDLTEISPASEDAQQPIISVSLDNTHFQSLSGPFDVRPVELSSQDSVESHTARYLTAAQPQSVETVGQLRFVTGTEVTQVPLVSGPGLDELWLRNQPAAVTEQQQAVFQQNGYQVNQKRRIMTATMTDGRRIAVPIDDVQLRYTGSNPQ